jgi:hypothetical protein
MGAGDIICGAMGEAIYQSDPDAASDEGFVPGALAYAVAGNRGRLLDARRTPLTVCDVIAERGEFEVRIEAFEDLGARWRLPVWEITHVQFASGSARAAPERVADLERAVERFDRELVIPADAGALGQTRRRVADARAAVDEVLTDLRGTIDVADCIRRRTGDPRLYERLHDVLAERDLVDLDRDFAATMVSNPHSGELVKGHAIVLAELGLCPYHGKVVRDPALFDADRSRARRAEHLIARIAFARGVWRLFADGPPTVYRAAAVDGPLPARVPASFVSGTLSEEVAAAHFAGGPTTRTAVMWRQVVDPQRLVMTFLETAAMNERYSEAEAVLIGDPANLAF